MASPANSGLMQTSSVCTMAREQCENGGKLWCWLVVTVAVVVMIVAVVVVIVAVVVVVGDCGVAECTGDTAPA